MPQGRFRRAGARGGAGVVMVALLAALAVPLAGAAEAVGADPGEGAGSEAEASALAVASGQRVEVLSLRGEREQVFALPEGGFTLEQSSAPERVLQGNEWVQVDTTLVVGADGRLRPRAAALAMTLSQGGSGPLVTVAEDGVSTALSLPFALPAPVLDGETAVYPEVLPGVDLQVRAHPEAFSEVLIVKSAQAAAQPALQRIRVSTQTSGGVLTAQADGGFAVLDRAGEPVLDSPPPVMWDSASSDSAGGPGEAADDDGLISEQTGAPQGQHSPAEGDQVAPVAATVVPGGVDLVPSRALLSDPDATFPLYIDPTIAADRKHWAMVNESYPTTAYLDWNDADQGVGYNTYKGINKKRLFWQFDTAKIVGKAVTKATFTARQTFAANCNTGPISLYQAGALGSPTWNAQPALYQKQDTLTIAAGRPECYPDGLDIAWNALGGAQSAAANGWKDLTLALKADDEATNDGWKRFQSTATFSVTYNTPPTQPATADMSTSPATACVTGTGRPVVGDFPQLRAKVSDPDDEDRVAGTFKVNSLTSTSETLWDSPYQDNGSQVSVSPTLGDGKYAWRVRAFDNSNRQQNPIFWGEYSPPCEFEVDSVRPSAAPTISSVEYPNNAYTGGIGQQGWFRLGAGGISDVASYSYTVDSGAPRTVAATSLGGIAAVPIRPAAPGPHQLVVTSLDRAGNSSTSAASYRFFVRTQAGPAAQVEFDESSPSATSATEAVAGNTLTFGSASQVTRVSGTRAADGYGDRPGDKGLQFAGGTGSVATTTAPVLGTGDSFTVLTQVKVSGLAAGPDNTPTGPAGMQQVVSQDGATDSVFSLGYDGSVEGFFASVRPATGAVVRAVASPGATNNVLGDSVFLSHSWIALAAVYDARSDTLKLYANGTQLASASTTELAPAKGSLRLGAGQSATAPARFTGRLDDVRVWSVPLPVSQIQQVSNEASPSVVSGPSTIVTGSTLTSSATPIPSGSHLLSPDRDYDLWMRPDGNVTLTGPDGTRWAANTASPANAGSVLRMETGGALVLQTLTGGRVVVRAGSTSGAKMTLTDDGGLELRSSSGALLSTTWQPRDLQPGDWLRAGDELQSSNGMIRLVMQTDGNLALLTPSGVRWTSGTASGANAGAGVVMQGDGNLVIYASGGPAVWAANGQSGDHLALHNDGDFSLWSASGVNHWSSRTATFPWNA